MAALAASRRRPTGDPGAPLRPKSDPQAPQKQPRGSHGNGLAALAAPRQRHRGYSDTPLRPQNDAQAAQERPRSRLQPRAHAYHAGDPTTKTPKIDFRLEGGIPDPPLRLEYNYGGCWRCRGRSTQKDILKHRNHIFPMKKHNFSFQRG